MIMVDHENLIQHLASDVPPVSRPMPVAARALVWAAIALASGLLASRLIPTATLDWSAPGAWLFLANAAIALFLGFLGLAFAFNMSIPGRQGRGFTWMLAIVGVWLLVNGLSIALSPHPIGEFGEGRYCFRFVALAGAPMIAVTLLALGRTGSLQPLPTLAMAGTGIGFLAFGLLAFCHPPEMSLVDFVIHLLAGAGLGGVTILVGRWLIAV